MSQEFQQHWLSAYLDNELSSDERALVERRLEEDAEARQLLDDLKRVRGLVATLPAWPGSNFQFDMSRLSEGEDDDDVESSGPDRSHSAIHTASPIDGAQVVGKVVPGESVKGSARMSMAAWRGVLSLAAGLLLLILCVPLFWQREADTFAVGTPMAPKPEYRAPGGMMSDTGSMAGAEAGNLPPSAAANPVADAPTPEASVAAAPMAPSPIAAAPFNAPTDPRQFDGGRGIGSAPGPSRGSTAPSSRAMTPMAPGPMQPKIVTESLSAQPELADNKLGSPVAEGGRVLSESLMCAKSEAWSETEVQQALPQLLRYVAENRRASDLEKQKVNPADKDAATSKPAEGKMENYFVQVAGLTEKNELLIGDLPQSAEVNNWFEQIQTTPVTQIQLTPELQLKALAGKDLNKLAESVQLQNTGQSPPVAVPSAAAPKEERLPAKPKTESTEVASELNVLQAKKAATSQGHLILFLTAAEAREVLSIVFPDKPSDPAEKVVADKNSEDKKVILILNR